MQNKKQPINNIKLKKKNHSVGTEIVESSKMDNSKTLYTLHDPSLSWIGTGPSK